MNHLLNLQLDINAIKSKEQALKLERMRLEMELVRSKPQRPSASSAQRLAQRRNWAIRSCRSISSQLHNLRKLAEEINSVEAENLINSIEFMAHSLESRLTEGCDARLRKYKVRKHLAEQMQKLDKQKVEDTK